MSNKKSLFLSWFAIVLLIAAAMEPSLLWANENPEATTAYNAARKAFQDGFYDRAEAELGAFVAKFTNSVHASEAILLQGQSRFLLKRYDATIELLSNNVAEAGALADQYQYWVAEAQVNRQDYAKAAELFASILKTYTNSNFRLEASYGEAFSHFRLRHFEKVIDLLRNPDGPFHKSSKTSTNTPVKIQGDLLLGEALFSHKDYAGAEITLNQLTNRSLNAETEWQRQYLLTSVALASQQTEVALQRSTNLVAAAEKIVEKPVLLGNSLMLQAEVFRQKNDLDGAANSYRQITRVKGIPSGLSRQAVMKVVEVAININSLTNAIQPIESFMAENPQDPSMDVLRLTCGQLYLRQFYSQFGRPPRTDSSANPSAATNLLALARSHFNVLINSLTNSPHLGKAQLEKGWTLWEERQFSSPPPNINEGLIAFRSAAELLPKASLDQALAQFKWADCQLLQKDYTNAVSNYRFLLEQHANNSGIKEKLFDQIYYQLVRAYSEVQNFSAAKEALDLTLASFPKSDLSQQALLLYGQMLLKSGRAGEARASFLDYLNRFAGSPRSAEVQLLVAETYLKEENWSGAIGEYSKWVTVHTNHPSWLQAEFNRGWSFYKANQDTNALPVFTNLVTKFPTHELAPLARYWMAQYYYRIGNFGTAEELFLNTNILSSPLRHQARLMAAQSALRRSKPADADAYLKALINSGNTTPDVEAQAWFLMGEAYMKMESPATNVMQRFEEAVVPFDRINNDRFAKERLAPIARGKVANCYYLLKRYDDAKVAYNDVLKSPLADVTTKNEAQFGLAKVIEEQARQAGANQKTLLNQALQQFLEIVYEKAVDRSRGEKPNPFWINKAGREAVRLAEELRMTEEAIKLSERLLKELPPLFQPSISNKLAELKQSKK